MRTRPFSIGMAMVLVGVTSCRPPTEAALVSIARGGSSVKERLQACEELGRRPEAAVVNALIEFLDDPILERCAARSLGQTGNPRAVNPLIAHLRAKDGINREAVWALGELRDAAAVGPLRQVRVEASARGALVPDIVAIDEALSKLGAR